MKDEELINEAEAATQNNGEDKESDADKDKIVYYDYEIKKINDCKYIILKGELKSPSRNAKIIQYTTIINGYGITVSYRAYDNANIEDGYILMDEVIDSVDVKVVETNNPKMTIVEQLLPIVLLIISFICITLFIRKRKKSS